MTDSSDDEEWVVEERKTHYYFEYGRWFSGYGSSMDQHRCSDALRCVDVVEHRKVTPWTRKGVYRRKDL